MRPFATVPRLAALLALFACAASTLAQTVHDTDTVQFEVFGDGFLSRRAFDYAGGFVFNGRNGLFEGQLLVGVSETQVSGHPYAGNTGQPPPEWVNLAGPVALAPPLPAPFDEGYEARYDDSNALSGDGPVGVTVTERSYSSEHAPNDDFVMFTFEITSGTDLDSLYVGVWADFDVSVVEWDLGDYDEDTRLLYVHAFALPSNYYGVAAINGAVSGWEFDVGNGYNPAQADLYTAMTNGGDVPPTSLYDRRPILGTGPYRIPAGNMVTVQFAFVAGENEADILANAQAAQDAVLLASEEPAEAAGFRLHDAYPNPFGGRTTLAYALARPQAIRFAVHDVLGREVALLAEGTQPAGAHRVLWDASALASGVYLVRLETAGASLARRVLLAK